jgi:AraC family transcriptional activator FtrA
MHRNLDQERSIPDLARLCAMSERTFMRRFKQRPGMAPAEWMSVARVDRARELLESTRLPIDVIASECGLGSAANLRHHFRRRLKVSPREYRNCFGRHPG